MQHVCKSCGVSKSLDQFNKVLRDGPLEPWNIRRCKTCSHAEYVERCADPRKRRTLYKASVKWKKDHPEEHARLAREYRARNPEKIMAQNRLNYAVRKGNIKRQPCEVCGTGKKVHAHHRSYKPQDWYNVRWLCFRCHKQAHMKKE